MGWLDRFKRKPAGLRLADVIGDYPPYTEPFPRPFGKLKLGEAEANFAHLVQVKDERLGRFGALLSRFGLDLHEGLTTQNPEAFLTGLVRWTADQWPDLRTPELEQQASWSYGGARASPALGLVMDTGLLLGEMIVRRRPDFAWALNLDPDDRVMGDYRRPCVIRPAEGEDFRELDDPIAWAWGAFRSDRKSVV